MSTIFKDLKIDLIKEEIHKPDLDFLELPEIFTENLP